MKRFYFISTYHFIDLIFVDFDFGLFPLLVAVSLHPLVWWWLLPKQKNFFSNFYKDCASPSNNFNIHCIIFCVIFSLSYTNFYIDFLNIYLKIMYSAIFEAQIVWWLPFSFLKSSFSFFDDVLIFQNQMNFFTICTFSWS